ncbi:TPA: hypothetical protein ACXM9H_005805 [Burkholderia multivorans]
MNQLQGQVAPTPSVNPPTAITAPAPAEKIVGRSPGVSSSAAPKDMIALPESLDRLKQAKGFHADIALAEYSQWRTGKTAPTTDEAWRIALELGVNPLMVIACVAYQFSPREKRQVWLDLAGTLMPSRSVAPASVQTQSQPASSTTASAALAVPWHLAARGRRDAAGRRSRRWIVMVDDGEEE